MFWILSFVIFLSVYLAYQVWPPILWSLILFGPLFIMGVMDLFQTRHGVRRNFPVIGNLRFFFEMIRPELQQYFVESNLSGRPIPRDKRSLVYQRAKGQLQTVPFGTQRDVYDPGYEWVQHSMVPQHPDGTKIRVTIGLPETKKKYSAQLLNISAMSYGALSKNAITALNLGAKQGGFYHNTGEGGLSPYHLSGGDVVWQIGTGYFGCRDQSGRFDPQAFKEKSQRDEVKMIEIKISQGAKPGKGGVLPAPKVTPEVAAIRLVEPYKSVLSPAGHSEFSTPAGLLEFVARLRDLSGSKPVGFKICIGKRSEFLAICKAMVKTGLRPDFITVDGGEGGTGAAPLEFTDSVGEPLVDGLVFVHDSLVGFGLRKDIKIIAAGKILTSFDMIAKMALGADLCNSARGMMLALGCIHALKCNTNHCPVGVATTDPALARGLHVPSKKDRVQRFQSETLTAFGDLLGAMGYSDPKQIRRQDILRRLHDGAVKSYEEMFPSMREGFLLDQMNLSQLDRRFQTDYQFARAESF